MKYSWSVARPLPRSLSVSPTTHALPGCRRNDETARGTLTDVRRLKITAVRADDGEKVGPYRDQECPDVRMYDRINYTIDTPIATT
jgi:hypothetical protein